LPGTPQCLSIIRQNKQPTTGSSSFRNPNTKETLVRIEERKRIPSIDLEAPAAIQTATFGMG
jgi:hypothetical protein